MKPRLLDLFCCAGGAAKGYADAGFEVVGVDINPQPRYPYPFLLLDVLGLDYRFVRMFDAVHASPPCQAMTALNNDKSRHLNLIPQTRLMLEMAGVPYVIENVVGAREHLQDPVSLTGLMFDMHMVTSSGQRFDLSRERLFETNWGLPQPWAPSTENPIANIFGGHLRCRSKQYRTGKGTGKTVDFPGEDRPALARQLMGMPWASMGEMSEAVPPAFTAYIGEQLLAYLATRRAAA